ncbi:hypothetical protein EB796_015072 [Bugula neritina]|uniref:Uncharacterized protein n=1 Tax=Bugula neritina TaxID=10212 RepID=A0A7J7JL86_BUGNE|nr:hypothetical protein EB796_015072 [Bugula neritina]
MLLCSPLYVQDLRASERTLKVRIKSLTNELAVYKRKAVTAEHSRPLTRQSRPNSARATRGQANISGGSTGTSFYRNRSSSRERGRSLSADRGHSAERRTNSRYDNSQPRLKSSLAKSSSPFHRQSSPYDRLSHHRSGIPSSQGNSRNTFHKTPSPRTALKPSPAGTRKPRFDPTAYITEKKRRQETKNNIRGTRSSPNLDGLHSRGRSRERVAQQPPRRRNRHSSVESIGSVGSVRRSRNSSCSEGNMSDSSHASSQYRVTKQRRAWQGDSPSEDIYTKKHSIRPSTSTPHSDRLTTRDNLRSDSLSEYLNHSADIDDIDARIQRINDMINERI